MKKIGKLLGIAAMAAVMSFLSATTSYADDKAVCLEAVSDEDMVKAYIRNAADASELSYQIGNIPADNVKSFPIGEDENPVRTLLMLDNSISIPDDTRDDISSLMNGIIDQHLDGEMLRLATFAGDATYLTDSYSDDYTALKNILGSVEYVDQETYLTDVLYAVLDDLNKEHYMGYTRIVIISDGVDNNPLGVTREELFERMGEMPYPIYTIGIDKGSNGDLLKNMFAISRQSETPYWTLNDQNGFEIADSLKRDSDILVVQAEIPSEAKIGGTQSSKLSIGGKDEVIFDVTMPFSVKEEDSASKEAAEEPETESSRQAEIATETAAKAGQENESGASGAPVRLILVGSLAAIAIIGLCVAIFLIIRNRGKGKRDEPPELVPDIAPADDGETVIVSYSDDSGNPRQSVLPQSAGNTPTYRLVLTDTSDPSRSFQCELRGSAKIGLLPDNDIVIGDDRSVSKHHCKITDKSGRFFIVDVGSTNGTYLNGNLLMAEKEITSGCILKMGRSVMSVKIERQ